MELLLRTFLVVNGQIKRIGLDRFSRIGRNGLPEFAGQRIPYAILAFENEDGKLGELRYREFAYFVFDKNGNVDRESDWAQFRMTLSSEGDSKSFAARRAKRIRKENIWSPTGDQLRQMIALVTKKA
jgi:hypothetical protein